MIIKAIETEYKNHLFRSRLEARWAVFLDTLGVKYEYEKESFELESVKYLPDFWLPELDCWLEIKGQSPTEKERAKARELAAGTNKTVFMLFECERLTMRTTPSLDTTFSGSGLYFLPNGDCDGCMEFGICPKCEKVGIGHRGSHDVSYLHDARRPCDYDGSWASFTCHPRLLTAYRIAGQMRFGKGGKW